MFRYFSVMPILLVLASSMALADVTETSEPILIRDSSAIPNTGRSLARLEVLSDGSIKKFEHFSSAARVFGTFSDRWLLSFKRRVEGLENGPLTDLDKGKPECEGGNTVSYSVLNEKGMHVLIAQTMNCHHFLRSDLDYSQSVRDMLEGLHQAASFLPLVR